MIGWVLLIAVVLLIVIAVGIYNGLVRLKVQVDNAWADIDVQLKRRYDLIPNLVETVKGYAGHEKRHPGSGHQCPQPRHDRQQPRRQSSG